LTYSLFSKETFEKKPQRSLCTISQKTAASDKINTSGENMQPANHKNTPLLLALIFLSALACQTLTPTQKPATEAPPSTAPSTEAMPPTEISTDPLAGSPGLNDTLYPGFGNGGYDTQTYILDITVNDISTSDLEAVTTITAIATQDLSRFNLDFIGFDIISITVNDKEAEFNRQGQELEITPSEPLQNGEAFTIVVNYQGTPEELISESMPVSTGWIPYDGGIFVLSEPDGSANYYPVNDHPLDKATYTIIVTVPKPYEVAANGILEETTDNGDSTTYHFTVRDPMASYLTTININDFDVETMESKSGVPIRNYYSASLPEDVRKPFARQGEMIDYFSEIFGEYPFEVYGAMVIDAELGSALENQTMSIFGTDMVDVEDIPNTELTVAHELAHQWFGDSVSVADWGDIWLNEGFASYAEGLWIEHAEGSDALNEWVTDVYNEVRDNPQYYPPPGHPAANDLFNGGVYYRGGLTLHALRLKVGDDVFFNILRTYAERYKFGNATTADFIQTANEISGEDLGDLFNAWLYDEALPPIPELRLE